MTLRHKFLLQAGEIDTLPLTGNSPGQFHQRQATMSSPEKRTGGHMAGVGRGEEVSKLFRKAFLVGMCEYRGIYWEIKDFQDNQRVLGHHLC